MKVGIFETEHFEGAYPVIKLFDDNHNRLYIFTNEKTHKCFLDLLKKDANKYHWQVQRNNAGKLSRFFMLYKNLKKNRPDIFYINTISNNHLLYAAVLLLLKNIRVVLTVHDINCLFAQRMAWSIREIIKYIGKKLLVRRVNEFNVVSETMVEYLKTKIGSQKKIHNIPGAVYENVNRQNNIDGYIHLVIPGSIDAKRRNYNEVFLLLNLAEEKNLPLHISLLGGYNDNYGKSIINKAANYKSNFSKLFYFDTDIVEQNEFDRTMDAAHFVFIPSVINTFICGDIPEVYGLTKSSGNIFDVIKHAKPFIVPAQLSVPPALESSCLKYSSLIEVVNFLNVLMRTPDEYIRWRENASANSKQYSIEKIREKNASLFLSVKS